MGLVEILCVFVMLIVFLCSWALWTAFCRHNHCFSFSFCFVVSHNLRAYNSKVSPSSQTQLTLLTEGARALARFWLHLCPILFVFLISVSERRFSRRTQLSLACFYGNRRITKTTPPPQQRTTPPHPPVCLGGTVGGGMVFGN